MWRSLLQYGGLVTASCAEALVINHFAPNCVAPISLIVVTLTWCAYLELSVGGLFIRPNSEGGRSFVPEAACEQIVWPLGSWAAWHPEFWDLNYYLVIGGTALAYHSWRRYSF